MCLLVLALVVTTRLMQLPAFTQQKPTYCGIENHEHEDSCYSDPTADVEDEQAWQVFAIEDASLAPAEALARVAQAQLGYEESEHNYAVLKDGSHAGYTRYGQWVGDSYAEWNAPFVAFCLQYAGIDEDEYPRGVDAESWVEALRTQGLYEDHAKSAYEPQRGDLVFCTSGDGRLLVGITEGFDTDKDEVELVIGGLTHEVCQRRLAWPDRDLVGFGRLTDKLHSTAHDGVQAEDGQDIVVVDGSVADDVVPVEVLEQDALLHEEPTLAEGDEGVEELLEEPTTETIDDDENTEPLTDQPTETLTELDATVDGLSVHVQATLPDDGAYELTATQGVATDEQVREIERSQSQVIDGGVRKTARIRKESLVVLDLTITDAEGHEVEPSGPADVTVEGEHAASAETPAVAHYVAGDAQMLDVQCNDEGISFQTPSFSTFVLAFTVDFYYEGYEFHMPGKGQIGLQELLDALSITVRAEDVADVTFSDPTLLRVDKVNDEWVLASLMAFSTDESLTITMKSGDVYVIAVKDAKTYSFEFNVNYDAAGSVYDRSPNFGERIWLAVTGRDGDGGGTAAGTVRPRSATEPTNGKYSATPGFHFVDWVVNGTTPYSTATDIKPEVGKNGVEDRAQTFTARFVVDGGYIVTYDREIPPAPDGGMYGSIQQGTALTFDYLQPDGTTGDVWFGYSGYATSPVAVPTSNGKFAGWYNVETDELVCESEWFEAPADLSEHITVQARFLPAQQRTVTYRAYFSESGSTREGGGRIALDEDASAYGTTVHELRYEQHWPGGATAVPDNGYAFVGWRTGTSDVLSAVKSPVFSRDVHLAGTSLDTVTQDVTYWAEFAKDSGVAKRVLFLADPKGAGTIGTKSDGSGKDATGEEVSINVAAGTGLISLKNTYFAVPAPGHRFDHWEFNGEWLSASNSIKSIDKPATTGPVQELKAVFVPICNITWDTGVIQQVGNNAPDFQHWEDVPWCAKDVLIVDKGAPEDEKLTETVDFGTLVVLPDLVHNSPDGTQTIRVTKTNNGYNLLTHTFKGWRFSGDSNVYAPGQAFYAYGSYTLEAVWDAYLPNKTGYYGTGDQVYRHNTNTCGFFVRLFDGTFNIGNTNTYTDCLFTSRLFLSGTGDFATNEKANGKRFDFFGYSQASEREVIDNIDADLRALANTGVPYSEKYSGQSNGDQFPGSIITFEQQFPSDELIFGRIREWNLGAPESRKIQINGHKIPQSQLTPDYFDLRWYVLKDQENSWHVDGMLIPKYAKLVVRKRFEGARAAIDAVKAGKFYIGVDESKDKVGSSDEEFKLRLEDADVENGEYVWRLDQLEPLRTYWVGEHSFSANTDVYSTSKSISLYNTSQSKRETTSYRMQVDQVYSYPDYASWDEVQTVRLTNHYTQKREITLVKQDATTGNPLAGTSFDVSISGLRVGQDVAISHVLTTDESGMISLKLDNPYSYEGKAVELPAGAYHVTFAEREREGYQPLPGPIEGTLHLSDTEQSTIELDQGSVYDGLVSMGPVDATAKNILYVRNRPHTTRVSVRKRWTNNANTPVTMQLLRNGVPVIDQSTSQPSVQLDASNRWSYVWEDLPSFIDGREAIYTVREEWIGEPGGTQSVHYNGGVDTDGYADYIVSQAQTASMMDGNEVVSVYVENTPDSGSVVFAKVDDSQRAVVGAEFTVYSDKDCRIPITVADFAEGTSKQYPAVFVSDANGMVTIAGILPGTYYMRETKAPSGYALADEHVYQLNMAVRNSSITHVGDASGTGLTQVVDPVYRRKVRVRKVDAGNVDVPLQGAVFSLHASQPNGSMAAAPMSGCERLMSDAKGYVDLGELKVGEYYLMEEQAPKGYKKLNGEVRITVPGDDATTITAIKVEGNTGLRVLDGVVLVPNSAGDQLPATGGAGEALPVALGCALVLPSLMLAWQRWGRPRFGKGGEASC